MRRRLPAAPSDRVFVRPRRDRRRVVEAPHEGSYYLSVKLDDPSFPTRSTPTSSMAKSARSPRRRKYKRQQLAVSPRQASVALESMGHRTGYGGSYST
jgi:hypothetical protein